VATACGQILIFSALSGLLQRSLPVLPSDIIGLATHPTQAHVVAGFSKSGELVVFS
jgi:hypothetical protein